VDLTPTRNHVEMTIIGQPLTNFQPFLPLHLSPFCLLPGREMSSSALAYVTLFALVREAFLRLEEGASPGRDAARDRKREPTVVRAGSAAGNVASQRTFNAGHHS